MSDQPQRLSLPDFDALWDYADPSGSERRFRELLPAAEASGDGSYFAQLLSQVARAQCLQRRYADADATLDRAEALMTPESHLPRVRCLLERGRIRNDQMLGDRGRAVFLEAWEIARRERIDGHAVDAAHMLGIIASAAEAVEWNLRALEYARQSPDPKARRWAATLSNNLGWTYSGMGEHEKALDLFRECRRLREEQGSPGGERVARWSIAKTLRLMGRADEALAAQQAIAGELRAAGEVDGYTHEELGECLLALGRGEEARPHFARAYELLSNDPWFPPTEPDRLERMRRMGQTEADPRL